MIAKTNQGIPYEYIVDLSLNSSFTGDIGFGSPKISRGYVNGQEPILIYNSKDLKGVKPNQTIILAHTSQKNKIEVAKKAKELNIKIKNLNIKKTIRSEKIKFIKNKIPELLLMRRK